MCSISIRWIPFLNKNDFWPVLLVQCTAWLLSVCKINTIHTIYFYIFSFDFFCLKNYDCFYSAVILMKPFNCNCVHLLPCVYAADDNLVDW